MLGLTEKKQIMICEDGRVGNGFNYLLSQEKADESILQEYPKKIEVVGAVKDKEKGIYAGTECRKRWILESRE